MGLGTEPITDMSWKRICHGIGDGRDNDIGVGHGYGNGTIPYCRTARSPRRIVMIVSTTSFFVSMHIPILLWITYTSLPIYLPLEISISISILISEPIKLDLDLHALIFGPVGAYVLDADTPSLAFCNLIFCDKQQQS